MAVKTVKFNYDIQDRVRIPTDVTGRIDALMTSINGIEYRVVYWADGNRCSVWMYEWELTRSE